VAAALKRALAKTPADRFSPVALFAEALGPRPRAAEVPVPTGRGPGVRLGWAAGLVLAAALVIALVVWGPFGGLVGGGGANALAAPRPWVIVADFQGPADDPGLVVALRELASAALDQSRQVTPIPHDELQSARRLAEIPDTVPLTTERARHLAYRTAVTMVLEGRVDRVGTAGFSIVLRLVDVEDGRVLATASGSADATAVIAAMERIVRSLRSQIGEARPRSTEGLTEVMTPSFEAYRIFVEAQMRNWAGDYLGAARLARAAVELDHGFASAWWRLGVYYGNAGLADSGAEACSQAALHADRLTPVERARLAGACATSTLGAVEAFDQVLQLDPGDLTAYNSRHGPLLRLGRYEEGVASLARAIELSPFAPRPLYLASYAGALAALGRIEEARTVAARLAGPLREQAELVIALASADWTRAESIAVSVESEPTQAAFRRMRSRAYLAGVQAARGEVAAAEQSLNRSWRTAITSGVTGGDLWEKQLPLLLLAIAADRTRGRPEPGLAIDTSSAALIVDGVWAAYTGDAAVARENLQALRGRSLDEGFAVWRDARLADAALAAVHEDWAAVVQILRQTALEGGGALIGALSLKRWLLADAYQRLGHLDSAAVFFEMLVSPTRMLWQEFQATPLAFSFAQFRLARLYTQLGERAKAKERYATFLETFTRPDPEYAWMVAEARAKLEELARGR
jgi:tetratricopeptide (TPR) repeat protein